MHDLLAYHIPESVRININAVDENGQPLVDTNGRLLTLNQFSVDPQITNFSVLESIIVKAFNFNGEYMLTYLNRSLNEYIQLKSDWDLENAYLGNAKPFLDIRVQKMNVSKNLNDEWDYVTTSDLTYAPKQTSQLANNFLNKMERMVFRAFNKAQFDEELDENCNIANTTQQQEEHQTAFSRFNLLSKFKRRSTLSNDTNQKQLNQQVVNQLAQSSQQTKSITPNSSTNLLKASQSRTRTSSNLSTSSIRSSNYSLTRKDLSKRHTIKKRDLKANQPNLVKVKRISSVQDNQILHKILGKAINLPKTNLYDPLTEQQYLKYLHPDGRIKCLRELRLAIYRRGIEPSLRSTLYKHLLNVYPPNMNSEQRVRFVQQKADQYYQLCSTWQRNFSHPKVQQIYNQVRKDVLRTDRSHPFYVSKCNLDTEQQNDITSSVSTYSSILTQFDMRTNESSMNSSYTNDYSTGVDQSANSGVYENQNMAKLCNILTTYSLNHSIGYWQGMSDICSPLLLAIQNEADTYICFTALMRRLSANFNGDECMANKFDLLRKLVQHYDPEFFDYLEQQQASDLLFCYRWLLLEMKREFKLDNALYMLEVSWSAMPPKFYPDLPTYDKKFVLTNDEQNTTDGLTKSISIKSDKSSKPVSVQKKQTSRSNEQQDAESVNSSKTLSNSVLSSKQSATNQLNFSGKLMDNHNIKNLKSEMSSAASDLGKQLSNSVNSIRKSVNEVANVASEFYANLNNNQQSNKEHKSSSVKSTVRSTLKGLKLSSVEEQLACKREKFHQQNTTGHSVSSLNEMRFSLDKDLEGNQRKSKNSSLNGSNHSLIEYNNTLNYILNKTQAMLKQQKFSSFNFNLKNSREESTSCLSLFKDSSKENRDAAKCSSTTGRQNHRHIRFLPKILSTDSNDNTIDSPDADEKCGGTFPHLINKQFSIDSVDSMEFNFNNNDSSATTMNTNLFKSSTSSVRQPFNNNFTCFSNFNSLPFTKQNSIPTQATLLKQQLKQSINQQQNHLFHIKQRSLPSSPLFKKKLDSFERPFLTFFQNVSNMLDKHMFVAEQHTQKMSSPTVTSSSMNTPSYSNRTQISSKRSKLISNQFDSFDQRDLFVHCNGETDTTNSSNNKYNSNWKPERLSPATSPSASYSQLHPPSSINLNPVTTGSSFRKGHHPSANSSTATYGLLNCFDSASFDGSSSPFQQQQQQHQNYNNASTSNCFHQRLARQLSDKLINEKMHSNSAARQSSCEERDGKKLLTNTQSVNVAQSTILSTSAEFRTLTGQLAKLNLSSNQQQQENNNTITVTDNGNQYLKTNHSANSSTATYEKEEKSEGYCSGSISDRNSNYEEQCTNLENDLAFNTFSNSTSSLKSSSSTSSSSSISSLSCSSSLVILSSNTSFKSKIAQLEKLTTLPTPHELSDLTTGNAFMLFISLTILLLHRDKIMNDNLDANDMAIYFDSHVRRHDVHLVVNIARELFQVYLNKMQGYQLAEMLDQSDPLDRFSN